MKSDIELEDLMLKMQQLEEDKENEEIERCIFAGGEYTPISEEKQLEYQRLQHARRRENAKNGVSWNHCNIFMNNSKPEVDALHRWGEDILAKTLL